MRNKRIYFIVSFLLQKALGLNLKEGEAGNKLEIGWVGSRGGCEGHKLGEGKEYTKNILYKIK